MTFKEAKEKAKSKQYLIGKQKKGGWRIDRVIPVPVNDDTDNLSEYLIEYIFSQSIDRASKMVLANTSYFVVVWSNYELFVKNNFMIMNDIEEINEDEYS